MIPVVPAQITAFGSHGVTIHHPTGATVDDLFTMDGSSSVVVGALAAGASIGRHPAIGAQVLMVAAGSVVVGDGADSFIMATGQAVLFESGEYHETRADQPATVVIWEHRDDLGPRV